MFARIPFQRVRLCQPVAKLAVLRTYSAQADKFNAAVQAVTKVPSVGNTDKLKLYALFKQATVGPNNTPKPGMFDVVGKAKHAAWSELGSMSKEDAMTEYIRFAESLGASLDGSAPKPAAAAAAEISTGDHLLSERSEDGHVLTLTLNRPAKRNALTVDLYKDLMSTLEQVGKDDVTRVVVLTGAGSYYSSGNDLSNFSNIPPEGPQKMADEGAILLENFVKAFITFPKILIAAVNGPAVGLPVTLLPLFDGVYASHKATFHTPFPALGQSPEACSSVTFPRIMGPTRANEMLIMGKKIDAATAKAYGLVGEVFESSEFEDKVKEIVAQYANLPPNATKVSKKLVRDGGIASVEELLAVNHREAQILKKQWLSDECMDAIMKFMTKGK